MSVNLSTLKKVELLALIEEKEQQLAALQQPVAPPAPSKTDTYFKVFMTIGLGCGIPLLSLALSKISGTLATHNLFALSLFAFGLMVSVLAVSLPHLAWAVSNITKSGKRASWSLAVALDLSIVLCEFCHVWAENCELHSLLMAVMGFVVVASMLLNCWAFFKSHN